MASQMQADEEQRMVLQIGADAGAIHENFDTTPLEVIGRTYAGPKQYRR
jgi:hypothetical protein